MNKFVIQPEKASSKASNVWNILTPGGVKLGTAAHVPDSIFVRCLRAIKFKANYGAKIAVCDADGNPILSITKDFSFGLFTARVKDVDGPVGTIKEEVLGLEGRRYVFHDMQGEELGCLEGDWRSYSLQIKEPRVASMGKLSRKAEGLNPVIFDEKNKYYVVDLYINPKNARWRRMLLGCCAAIDILLR
ncbi:hypothetical protein IJT17_07890 [bacterium]|nr:hypothetical protein [bacterium]